VTKSVLLTAIMEMLMSVFWVDRLVDLHVDAGV
jgi:hypothetical protein